MNGADTPSSLLRAPVAVFLAWLVPGLGHIFLGHRTRGIILLVALTLTFWTGVAIGGAKTVSPERPPIGAARSSEALPIRSAGGSSSRPMAPAVPPTKSWWFFGQMLIGSYAMGGLVLGWAVEDYSPAGSPRYLAWPSGDLANVYTGVAGLLNLLIILDAMARAERAAGRTWSGNRALPRGPSPGRG